MDRVAIFVDAGYLFAQGGLLLSGRKPLRGEIKLDHEKMVEVLRQFAERVTGHKVLRIYWYDGTSTGPTPQHIALAYTPQVKVRLGIVNSAGQQKGVDSLIVTDMLMLARNRAMSEAILLSGDEDVRVGVQQAQEYGIVVHLVGIKPARGSQSVLLLQEADLTYEWEESELAPFLSCPAMGAAALPNVAPATAASIPAGDGDRVEVILDRVADAVARDIVESELQSLVDALRSKAESPKQVDGKLLAKSRTALKQDLDSTQKKYVRRSFVRACEARLVTLAIDKAIS